uniref:EKC/KEOPS complex subunit Tprkb-like n=1 Tax=Myxine glutinosa TaxID=7769 RepID=UPI00358F1826
MAEYTLELFPDCRVSLLLFDEVKNAAQLRQQVLRGNLPAAFITPSMVLDPIQVLVAVNKSVHNHRLQKMKTHGLYSEIIYNLSPSKSITESFRRFGITDNDTSLLVITVDLGGGKGRDGGSDDPGIGATMAASVEGRQLPIGELSQLTDVCKIKKFYKVTEEEERLGGLLDAVVCRMAIREAL